MVSSARSLGRDVAFETCGSSYWSKERKGLEGGGDDLRMHRIVEEKHLRERLVLVLSDALFKPLLLVLARVVFCPDLPTCDVADGVEGQDCECA